MKKIGEKQNLGNLVGNIQYKGEKNIMEATIKSIERKKILNRQYFKIVIESSGREYVVSNPLLSDPINFRKQVFGILTACNCYDIMRLGGREIPIPQKAIGYYIEGRGYKIFENDKGQWFSFHENTGKYSCEKADEHTKQLIKKAEEYNISNVTKAKGTIESIKSTSGVFQMLFQSEEGLSSFLTTGQVYWGFGNPINIGNNATESQKLEAAKMFTSFITSLMDFYGENDLLKLGGEIETYPKVEIALNHSNKIKSIINPSTGLGIGIGQSYEMFDTSNVHEKGE